jgi:hypothetical protein
MSKKIQDYLHFYFGCKVQTPKGVGTFCTIGVLGLIGCGMNPGYEQFEPESIKPILRPLSDMTEDEKSYLGYSAMINDEIIWTPEKFRYALANKLDLFNLIHEGLAIAKTPQP